MFEYCFYLTPNLSIELIMDLEIYFIFHFFIILKCYLKIILYFQMQFLMLLYIKNYEQNKEQIYNCLNVCRDFQLINLVLIKMLSLKCFKHIICIWKFVFSVYVKCIFTGQANYNIAKPTGKNKGNLDNCMKSYS